MGRFRSCDPTVFGDAAHFFLAELRSSRLHCGMQSPSRPHWHADHGVDEVHNLVDFVLCQLTRLWVQEAVLAHESLVSHSVGLSPVCDTSESRI